MVSPPKAKAIERLRKVLNEIPKLKTLPSHSPEFKRWHRNALVTLRNTFEDNSSHLKEFNDISFTPKRRRGTVSKLSSDLEGTDFTPSLDPVDAYVKGLNSAEALLKSMIEEIEDFGEDDDQKQFPASIQGNDRPRTNEVFVIHGRDEGARELVARFLERLELKPVILHEQPNEGRTIIEKFEDHDHVGFALALLTPDDIGSLQGDKNNLKPRARQNVIFEFGYFIGKLGRERVCALVKGDVEKPSDYDGVLYIPLDAEDGWKQKLFQELDAAGYELDADRAFRT